MRPSSTRSSPFRLVFPSVRELSTLDAAEIAAAFPFDVKTVSGRVDILDRRDYAHMQISDLPRYATHAELLPDNVGLVIADKSGLMRVYGLASPGPIPIQEDDRKSVVWAGAALWRFLSDHKLPRFATRTRKGLDDCDVGAPSSR
jgi:hypothetical protein